MNHLIFYIFLALISFKASALLEVDKKKPAFWKKAETARWLSHQNVWGTFATTSVHLQGRAWAQPKSFVDGTIESSTGIPYFYDSDMDTSMEDANANNAVSFSITMAQQMMCGVNHIDPEDPRCARVVLSGKFVEVTDETELEFARTALFERHPAMASWPADHSWKIHKLVMDEVWLIDIYGGATFVNVDEYYNVNMNALDLEARNGAIGLSTSTSDGDKNDVPYSTCKIGCSSSEVPICTCTPYQSDTESSPLVSSLTRKHLQSSSLFNSTDNNEGGSQGYDSCQAACPFQVQPLCTCSPKQQQ